MMACLRETAGCSMTTSLLGVRPIDARPFSVARFRLPECSTIKTGIQIWFIVESSVDSNRAIGNGFT